MINLKKYLKNSIKLLIIIFLTQKTIIILPKENFWIGLRLPVNQINFSSLQSYLNIKISKIKPIKFKPVKWPHITFVEGHITNPKVKKRIDLVLKQTARKFRGKNLPISFLGKQTKLFGNPADLKFIVLKVDTNKSKNLFNLATTIHQELINLENKIHGFKVHLHGAAPNTPPELHLSLGKIKPPSNALNNKQQKLLKNILRKIDTSNPKTSPKLSRALKRFNAKEFVYSVTPPKMLNFSQIIKPQYVFGKYKL